MKKVLLLSIFAVCFGSFVKANPGDTVVVQTLTFEDITKRRGWYVFPDESIRWEKVLMYYTLKCDAATTQDEYPCGEWDYLSFTYSYRYNNVDFPYYTNVGVPFDSLLLSSQPSFKKFLESQKYLVIDSVISEEEFQIGSGSEHLENVFYTQNKNGRAQFIWKAEELNAIGLQQGEIDKIKLDVETITGELKNLKIRMKHTDFSELSSVDFEKNEFVTVYNKHTSFQSPGMNEIVLTNVFNWDGESNIVIDFSYSNDEVYENFIVKGESTSFVSGVYAMKNDGCFLFDKPDFIVVPKQAFETVSDKITISFWLYGDPNKLPTKTIGFQGRDSSNNRILNSLVPWKNSKVHWHAGYSNSSNDNVNDLAEFDDFAGRWNHYAFTKNAATGNMRIYINGEVFIEGTDKTKTMENIDLFHIAGNASQGMYYGYINEFTVWDIDLSEATINDWMFKDIDDTHPNYSNLRCYYPFNEKTYNIVNDNSGNDFHGSLVGIPSWCEISGSDQYRNMNAVNQRPNIIFVQGEYDSHLDSVLVIDSVENAPKTIYSYTPEINFENAGLTYNPEDTMLLWEAGNMYTYYGDSIVDSTYYLPDTTLVNYLKSEEFQIQNYVTPYGIQLDLGPNGFTWIYDVTDYLPVLRDTVDIKAGNQQELIDLKFVFIEGTPPRDILSMQQIWSGSYGHANIADDVALPAVDVQLNPDAEMYSIRTRTTGHGFGGYNNCAEFCPKHHHLKINGVKEFEWLNWTECAENPVYPQGGTWVYDRAGWCPGSFADTYNWDITQLVNSGDIVSIDYGMQSYPANGGLGSYRVAVQLFEYSEPNFENDAAIIDIVSPNNWEYFNRYNPICGNPIIEIRNTGTNDLTNLKIDYGIEGSLDYSYNWTGSLEFLESERVYLPAVDWNYLNDANEKFQVTVSNPNNTADEYEFNNTMVASYSAVPIYSGESIILKFKTNNAAHENDYEVIDPEGNTLFSRTELQNNTIYTDTIELETGCYNIRLLDSDDDGIGWWANNDGYGYFKIFDENSNLLKTLEHDFGKKIEHRFAINNNYSVNEIAKKLNVAVYPNPSDGNFKISLMQKEPSDVEISIFSSIGQLAYRERFEDVKYKLIDVNANTLPKGIYYLNVKSSSISYSQKIVID